MNEQVLIGILSIAGEVVPIGGDPYTGSYTVTPKVSQQVLPTSMKSMTQDLTITEIKTYQVSNPKGYTMIIGDI